MTKMIRNVVLVALAGAALAACGGDSKAPAPPVVVVPPAAKLEDQFGTNFGVDYRNMANTDATDPVSGDIVPLSLTTEPVTI